MSDEQKPPIVSGILDAWAAAHGLKSAEDIAREELFLMRQRAEAAEAALALVERYGADQWRRGNAGHDPQEFDEWRRDLEEWRKTERQAWQQEAQP